MGQYSDIKRRRMKKFLKWLSTRENIEIKKGGKHNQIIKYTFGKRPYPVPIKHNVVDKNIVKGLVKKLTQEWKVCSEEEINKRLH